MSGSSRLSHGCSVSGDASDTSIRDSHGVRSDRSDKQDAITRLRDVLRFDAVVETRTDEFSYCHDTVRLQSGPDFRLTSLVTLDGEAAEALKAVLDG